MFKSSFLSPQLALKKSIKGSWVPVWIVFLIAVAIGFLGVLYLFEKDVTALLMVLAPPSIRQGVTFYQDLVFLARVELLAVALFFVLTLIFYRYPPFRVLEFQRVETVTWAVVLVGVVSFFLSIFVALVILEAFPNSSDEYAYLFQAEMFSDGKWWERAHELPAFFYINNIPQQEGILLSRFPPGWPLLLSSAFEAGFSPALVNPVLAVTALAVLYHFARIYYGQSTALWSVTLVALSGYYLFNAGSFFSHVSCALFSLVFVFCIYGYRNARNPALAILAGFSIGMVVATRYYTGVLIFLPFLVMLLKEYRWKSFRLFLWMAVGATPCIAYLLWYNYSITGNALLPVTLWAYPNEGLGFVKGYTFMTAVEHFVRWIIMFVYWTSPGLLILYLIFLWRKIKRPAERLADPGDYAFLMLAAGYFFYYQIGGNQYGPRFMFEGFPFLVLFVVSKTLQSGSRWAVAILVACAVYPVLKFPFIAHREALIVDQRQDLYELIRKEKITHAVIFVCSPTSPLRPMPADDLTRNDAMFANDVVYILPVPGINEQIMEYYDGRAFYQYVREVDEPEGALVRIR